MEENKQDGTVEELGRKDDSKLIKGQLHLHSETGTEGGWWALQDERHMVSNCSCPNGYPPNQPHDHWSYDGLIYLEDGDHLKILKPDNTVYWEGFISLIRYPVFQESLTGSAAGENGYDISFSSLWIHADQSGLDRHYWAYPFMKRYRGELIRGLKKGLDKTPEA